MSKAPVPYADQNLRPLTAEELAVNVFFFGNLKNIDFHQAGHFMYGPNGMYSTRRDALLYPPEPRFSGHPGGLMSFSTMHILAHLRFPELFNRFHGNFELSFVGWHKDDCIACRRKQ